MCIMNIDYSNNFGLFCLNSRLVYFCPSLFNIDSKISIIDQELVPRQAITISVKAAKNGVM